MHDIDTDEWWGRLPEDVREQADAHILQDSVFQAIRVVWEAGRLQGLGLNEAQLVVNDRYVLHGDRVVRKPVIAPDVDAPAAEAAALPGRLVAIEAVWDGDTVNNWFVELVALTDNPEDEHRLTVVSSGTTPVVPGPLPHPAGAADEAGRELAARLSVPFHFGSPGTPDDQPPRYRS